ncbi:MAG: Chromosome partition protein Smc [Chlamydiia bacterium]|nr:Chromosome partition protein Smc [Chlamydiia bacterium]
MAAPGVYRPPQGQEVLAAFQANGGEFHGTTHPDQLPTWARGQYSDHGIAEFNARVLEVFQSNILPTQSFQQQMGDALATRTPYMYRILHDHIELSIDGGLNWAPLAPQSHEDAYQFQNACTTVQNWMQHLFRPGAAPQPPLGGAIPADRMPFGPLGEEPHMGDIRGQCLSPQHQVQERLRLVEQERDALTHRCEDLERRLDQATAANELATEDLRNVRHELQQARAREAALSEEVATLRGALQANREEVDDLRAQLRRGETDLADARGALLQLEREKVRAEGAAERAAQRADLLREQLEASQGRVDQLQERLVAAEAETARYRERFEANIQAVAEGQARVVQLEEQNGHLQREVEGAREREQAHQDRILELTRDAAAAREETHAAQQRIQELEREQGRLEETNRQLHTENGRLGEQIHHATERANRAEAAAEELRARVAALEARPPLAPPREVDEELLARAREGQVAMAALQERFRDSQTALARSQAQLENAQRTIEELREEQGQLRAQATEARRDRDRVNTELADARRQNAVLEERLRAAERVAARNEGAEREANRLRHDLGQAQDAVQRSDAQLREAEQQLAGARGNQAQIEHLRRENEDIQRRLANATAELEHANAQVRALQREGERADRAEGQLERAQGRLAHYEELVQREAQVREELVAAQRDTREARDELGALRERLATAEARADDRDEARTEIEQLRRDLHRAQDELQDHRALEERERQLQARLTDSEQRVARLEAAHEGLVDDAARAREEAARANATVEELRDGLAQARQEVNLAREEVARLNERLRGAERDLDTARANQADPAELAAAEQRARLAEERVHALEQQLERVDHGNGEELVRARADNARLTAELEGLRPQLAQAEEDRAKAGERADRLQRELTEQRLENEALERREIAARAEATKLNEEVGHLTEENRRQRAQLHEAEALNDKLNTTLRRIEAALELPAGEVIDPEVILGKLQELQLQLNALDREYQRLDHVDQENDQLEAQVRRLTRELGKAQHDLEVQIEHNEHLEADLERTRRLRDQAQHDFEEAAEANAPLHADNERLRRELRDKEGIEDAYRHLEAQFEGLHSELDKARRLLGDQEMARQYQAQLLDEQAEQIRALKADNRALRLQTEEIATLREELEALQEAARAGQAVPGQRAKVIDLIRAHGGQADESDSLETLLAHLQALTARRSEELETLRRQVAAGSVSPDNKALIMLLIKEMGGGDADPSDDINTLLPRLRTLYNTRKAADEEMIRELEELRLAIQTNADALEGQIDAAKHHLDLLRIRFGARTDHRLGQAETYLSSARQRKNPTHLSHALLQMREASLEFMKDQSILMDEIRGRVREANRETDAQREEKYVAKRETLAVRRELEEVNERLLKTTTRAAEEKTRADALQTLLRKQTSSDLKRRAARELEVAAQHREATNAMAAAEDKIKQLEAQKRALEERLDAESTGNSRTLEVFSSRTREAEDETRRIQGQLREERRNAGERENALRVESGQRDLENGLLRAEIERLNAAQAPLKDRLAKSEAALRQAKEDVARLAEKASEAGSAATKAGTDQSRAERAARLARSDLRQAHERIEELEARVKSDADLIQRQKRGNEDLTRRNLRLINDASQAQGVRSAMAHLREQEERSAHAIEEQLRTIDELKAQIAHLTPPPSKSTGTQTRSAPAMAPIGEDEAVHHGAARDPRPSRTGSSGHQDDASSIACAGQELEEMMRLLDEHPSVDVGTIDTAFEYTGSEISGIKELNLLFDKKRFKVTEHDQSRTKARETLPDGSYYIHQAGHGSIGAAVRGQSQRAQDWERKIATVESAKRLLLSVERDIQGKPDASTVKVITRNTLNHKLSAKCKILQEQLQFADDVVDERATKPQKGGTMANEIKRRTFEVNRRLEERELDPELRRAYLKKFIASISLMHHADLKDLPAYFLAINYEQTKDTTSKFSPQKEVRRASRSMPEVREANHLQQTLKRLFHREGPQA